MKAIVLRDYAEAPYATWMMEGLKLIETRKWAWAKRGDLVICCSQASESNNAGLALCVVDVFHIEPMRLEHEEDACCKIYPRAKSWFTRNLRVFETPFKTKGRIHGSAQSIFDLEVPDDMKLIPVQTKELIIITHELF